MLLLLSNKYYLLVVFFFFLGLLFFITISDLSLLRVTLIVSFSLMLRLIISSERGSSKYFCIALFKGLAPNFISNPFSAIKFFASSFTFTVYPRSSTRFNTFSSSMSMILLISSFSRLLNNIMSSSLFKNSGEKALYWISEDEAEWGGVKISFKGKVTSADLQKFIVAVMKEYDMDSVHLTAKQIVDVFIEDGIFVQGAQESKQNEA